MAISRAAPHHPAAATSAPASSQQGIALAGENLQRTTHRLETPGSDGQPQLGLMRLMPPRRRQRRGPFFENQIVKYHSSPSNHLSRHMLKIDGRCGFYSILGQPTAIYRRCLPHQRLPARRIDINTQEQLFIAERDLIGQPNPASADH